MTRLKKILIALLTALMAYSCSPERKLQRLIERNPQLKVTDTIFYHDTIFVPGVNHDTVFSIETILFSKDTIVIQKDRLTQKFFYSKDSIYIYGECASDTVYKDNFRVIEKYLATGNDLYKWLFWGVLALLAFLLWKFKK